MKERFAASLIYLYLMRFSLVLWLAPVILLILDLFATRVFTRAIFIPEHWPQYLCNAFFEVSSGMVALATARLVCNNGEDRFNVKCPPFLAELLGSRSDRRPLQALIIAQTPAIASLIWIACLAQSQGVSLMVTASSMLAGATLSVVFWIVVNALYVWTYDPALYAALDHGRQRPPRIILFPSHWLKLDAIALASGPASTHVLKRALHRCFQLMARLGPGFSSELPLPEGAQPWPLWEGHCFAFVSFIGFLSLYLLLFPLTAPLKLFTLSIVALCLLTVVTFALLTILWSGIRSGDGRHLHFRVIVSILLVSFVGAVWALYLGDDPQRFPIFSFVLILLTWTLWAGAALAFFLDRYRVPVLPLLALAFLIGNLFHPPSNDRYFTIDQDCHPVGQLPTPHDIFQAKHDQFPNDPLIIIAATGGGIHAAGWTAQILATLEEASAAKFGASFNWHDHILLLSTVSGGSLGAYTYLRELSAPNPFNNQDRRIAADRMTSASTCSGLDAIGWGLIYTDFVQSITGLPISQSGDESDDRGLFRDRTWALGAAFGRNLDDYKGCVNANSRKEVSRTAAELAKPQSLTLRSLLPAWNNDHKLVAKYPAFTMNTTAVESGERFLLANYANPVSSPDGPNTLFVPAASFLQVYGNLARGNGTHATYPDLPLSSAALLSATFPYVSSVSRIPASYAPKSSDNKTHFSPGFHFADGGYFDNDGVNSAIEFLCFALADATCGRTPDSSVSQAQPTDPLAATETTSAAAKPIQAGDDRCELIGPQGPSILFLEVRDGDNIKNDDANGWPAQQRNSLPPRNTLGQLGAPLKAFWLAGHNSATLRDRREMQIAIEALGLAHNLCHIVLPYHDPQSNSGNVSNYGLSWALTPKQRSEIKEAALKEPINSSINAAMAWIDARRNKKAPPAMAQKCESKVSRRAQFEQDSAQQ